MKFIMKYAPCGRSKIKGPKGKIIFIDGITESIDPEEQKFLLGIERVSKVDKKTSKSPRSRAKKSRKNKEVK